MMRHLISLQHAVLIMSLSLLGHATHADNRAIKQTKNQLKQIESKMNQIQLNISRSHDKQGVLTKALSHTEKQIQAEDAQLNKIQLTLKAKQQQITALQQQTNALNEQLHVQQNQLAKHMRARFKMGEYQPLKWLLAQDKPDTFSRLLTFHQYLVKSRQHMLDDIHKIKHAMTINENKLHQELIEQEHLQQQLNHRRQALNHDKQYRKALLESLTQDIQNKQQTLQTYQRNKENLSRLMTTLVQQSVLQTRHPFTQMRKKLQNPVVTNSTGMQKINQGVVFFCEEGTPVASVSAGKVVFGDWLNGYGLLLIVDHGWGFMTLYANNQSLLKHKGDLVSQGEKVATVGHSGTLKQNGLYFEIRQRGKAVNPLEWMASRRYL